jgi:hypothetical protein
MKTLFISILSSPVIFSLVKTIHKLTGRLIAQCDAFLTRKLLKELSIFQNQNQVLNGPFKGSKFHLNDTHTRHELGFNAILGSLEYEIHTVVEEIISRNYPRIIVIGAAEGYYAIGFANRCADTQIIAYETMHEYQQWITKNAALNGVENRVIVRGNFDISNISELNLLDGVRSCIFSDCEGYEKFIFSAENKSLFKNSDILIEIHDFVDPEISKQILSVYKDTHTIKIIDSINDDIRPSDYIDKVPQIKHMSYYAQRVALADSRPAKMQWFWMQAINS